MAQSKLLLDKKIKSDLLVLQEKTLSVMYAPLARKLLATSVFASVGVLGRVAFQFFPSIEPIIALSVIAGYFMGWRYGAMIGGSAFFASNFFVYGFHGPWTVFQVLGGVLAGASPAILGRFTKSKYGLVFSLGLATLIFELSVNLGTAWFWIFGPVALVTALPFGIIHLASTYAFGMMTWSAKKEIGKLNVEDKYELKIRSIRSGLVSGNSARFIGTELSRRFIRRPFGNFDVESELRTSGVEFPVHDNIASDK